MSATPEQIADERADWLLDAIAGATQDRQFLRGDAECNPVVCEAVLLNGAKAIRTAIARAQAETTALGFPDACPCEQCANIRREQAREAIVAYLSAKSDAQAERVRVLEGLLQRLEPSIGWRSAMGTSRDFMCEFCHQTHEHFAHIKHTDDCPVIQVRAALRGAA